MNAVSNCSFNYIHYIKMNKVKLFSFTLTILLLNILGFAESHKIQFNYTKENGN